MPRVKSSVPKLRRKKRLHRRLKGFWGRKKHLLKAAKEARIKAEVYATKHRRLKKREFRYLWILRINAACRARGISYSRFIDGLKKANVALDRKALSDIAVQDAAGFDRLVEMAKKAG